ncbi:MAG: hypothetical protein AAGI68_00555 [Planctomycetota bacterium]
MSERLEIKPVTVPTEWVESLAVERLEDTRWYIERGSQRQFFQWLGELHRNMQKRRGGILIPLQWVPGLVGVSRTAVQKRAKSGGLTVFSYVITEPYSTLLGGVKERETKKRYDLVPWSECEQWRKILFEIAEFLRSDEEGW